jgi:predicted transcriptional regulator
MASGLKQTLEKLAKEKAPGPNRSFSSFHFLLALELVAKQALGRNRLAEKLGIGEGATRTLIGRLKDQDLILVSKPGCSLTQKGLKLLSEYQSRIKKVSIEKNELTFSDHSFAVVVRNSADEVKTGIEQRDAAVMAGAKGATTIIMRHGHLIFPTFDRHVENDFPKASGQIMQLLGPRESDTVIVVSSDTPSKAEHGVLAAAWTLLDCNRR